MTVLTNLEIGSVVVTLIENVPAVISGLTITKAKEKIKKQIILDEYNNDIKTNNVRLFYTDNKNYYNGSGFYLSTIGFTGGSEIKI